MILSLALAIFAQQAPSVLWVEEDRGFYQEGARLGESVANLSDLNGDGTPEFAIGLYWMPPRIYDGRTREVLAALVPSSNWMDANRDFGWGHEILGIADLDGDGIDDIVVGANLADSPLVNAGAVRAVSGASFQAIWTTSGSVSQDRLGKSMRVLPDATGDGVSDVLSNVRGDQVCLLDGKTGQVVWSVNLSSAFSINEFPDLETLEDVNGDGAGDFVLKTQLGLGASLELRSGATGAVLDTWLPANAATADSFGSDIENVGDQNGDGLDDVIVSGDLNHMWILSGADGSTISEMFTQRHSRHHPVGAIRSNILQSAKTHLVVMNSGTSLEFWSLQSGQPTAQVQFGYHSPNDQALACASDSFRDGRPEVLIGLPEYAESVGDIGIAMLVGFPAPVLEVQSAIAGLQAVLAIEDGPAGKNAAFFASRFGGGPSLIGGAVVLLTPPFQQVATARLDAQGSAVVSFPLPPATAGMRLHFQAAMSDPAQRLSTMHSVIVQ